MHTCNRRDPRDWFDPDADNPLELVRYAWSCEACDFRGSLLEAIAHAVKNQFVVVREKTSKGY